MSILKLNLSKKLLKFIPVSLEHIKTIRTVSNTSSKNEIKPIEMAYASYESTESVSDKIPPLIVMHGLFGSKGNWNSLCKAMQSKSNPKRKIFAVDARNHGDSPHSKSHSYDHLAMDIKHFMEINKIPKACLLGHSMGGKTVMNFALKYPDMVDRLIVVDISPFSSSETMGDTHKFFGLMSSIKIDPSVPLSAARREADSILARSIPDKGVRAFILTNLVKKNDGGYSWRINIPTLAAYYQKIAQFPNNEGLQYKGKTILLYGGLSDFVQKTEFKRIKEIFPQVKFAEIEGAGHWLHSEKPTEFLEYVVNFINAK